MKFRLIVRRFRARERLLQLLRDTREAGRRDTSADRRFRDWLFDHGEAFLRRGQDFGLGVTRIIRERVLVLDA
jgi:hypothetical protein